MQTFRYQAYDPKGKLESGAIQATSRTDAVKRLCERGLTPFKAELADRSRAPVRLSLSTPLFKKLSLADFASLTRELSVLLNAGVPLDHALRLMADETADPKVKTLVQNLLSSITEGDALSAAIEKHATSAPGYLANLVRAGEARGSIATVLADLAGFLQKRAEVSERVRSALTYPLALGVVALAAVATIVVFLVPALLPIFEDAQIDPPPLLHVAHLLGVTVQTTWPLLLATLLLTPMLVRRLLRVDRIRLAGDRTLLRLPIFGPLMRTINVAILARTLGTLLRNGVALVPALSMSAGVIPSRQFADILRTSARQVREGRRLAQTLATTTEAPKLLVRFIAIGEESSKLDEMLLHLADLTEADSLRRIDKITTLLPTYLTVVIGVLVGGLILSVMQAISSANQLVLQ